MPQYRSVLTMLAGLRLLVCVALIVGLGVSATAEMTPCLLVSGISFAPVTLLPWALQATVTEQTPAIEIEGLKLVPVRHLAVSNGAQLTWNSQTRTIDFHWQGREVALHALPHLAFWRDAAIVGLTGFHPQTTTARCLSAVDGDTIELADGEKVRYIGVDTPETKHPYKPVQFFGREASQFNRNLVVGKRVTLEYDAGRRDRYRRLLAYVYVGDIFVNAELAAEGYAQTATYPPNVRYQQLFLYLQKQAREAGKGLWSRSYPADDTTAGSGGKYLGSKNSHIYHYPGCKWAMKIKADNAVWFASAAEARAAGYRPCRVCKPPE